MIDFVDYPQISKEHGYRMYQIAHRCPMGEVPHHFDECGGYCVNLLVGTDDEGRETNCFEVYVDSSTKPADDWLNTDDRAVAEEFVKWIEAVHSSR